MVLHKKNELCRLVIESCGTDGEGVARLDGLVVFIKGAIPGEVCDVLLLKVGKSAAWGRIEAVVEPSPARLSSDCAHYPKCGGCQFRHMEYAAELEAKRQRVEDALRRIGGVELPVSEIFGAKNTERYRNKVQLPVSGESADPRIGFYRAHSHDVVNVADCLLQPETASVLCRVLRRWMTECAEAPYREESHTGMLRHVFFRFSQTNVLCCLVVNGTALPREELLVERLRAAEPRLSGVVLSVNQVRTNVILGDRLRTLWGVDYLDDTLCGMTFRISVPSFYQVNRQQAELLYEKALECAALTGAETVLDLYCGIGTISLVMAKAAGRVIGAEVVPQAVEDAKNNALRNGVQNVEFLCADAGEAAAKLEAQGVRPHVVCVDPPRKGLAQEVVDAVVSMAPERVVYVSCDPATLARDVKRFAEQGYSPINAVAVDLFPRTAHVECVVGLQRVGDRQGPHSLL